ncbi:MAG: dihydrolipoamide acetyltransferase family protein [Clostridia bacterium]
MATIVNMPKVGISVESCIITSWHFKKGDIVKAGDILFSFETDKTAVDEEAKTSGELLEILENEGSDVKVLAPVCIIGEHNEDISGLLKTTNIKSAELADEFIESINDKAESFNENKKSIESFNEKAEKDFNEEEIAKGFVENEEQMKNQSEGFNERVENEKEFNEEERENEGIAVTSATNSPIIITAYNENKGVKISKRAKRLAKKSGVNIKETKGTGVYGRICEKDVRLKIEKGQTYTKAALEQEKIGFFEGSGISGKVTITDIKTREDNISAMPSKAKNVAEDTIVTTLSPMRKSISKTMLASLKNSAQLTNTSSFDATSILAFRKKIKKTNIYNITLNDIILFATAKTILNHPILNAHLIEDMLTLFTTVNLGIAVDTERGIMVPFIENADRMSLGEISKIAKELATKARKGIALANDKNLATFTVTNLGTLGVESFTPIINPPQTAILGVCSICDKVKLVDEKVTIYKSMGLSLTYDHRVIDGAPAGKFIEELCYNLENFETLLVK